MQARTCSLRNVIVSVLLGFVVQMPAGAQVTSSGPIEHRVMAFYYPWYGIPSGPGGAGRVVHWDGIDAVNHDISVTEHYPVLGAYDSYDLQVIEQHCRWAVAAHIDTFIASWWGHNSYEDRALPLLLDACARQGLKVCIYYETVPLPQTAETAARDISEVFTKYAGHEAYLKVNNKPVAFIYSRAVAELGLLGWREAVALINASNRRGVVLLGDQLTYGAARVFHGIHTYNTAGSVAGKPPADLETWAAGRYPYWVQLADDADKISTLTVIPGYDDTKIRTPGLKADRLDGEPYRVQWEQAIAADPDWVLVTTFNEWHEGSEIEPSLELGTKYLDMTGPLAQQFKSTPRVAHSLPAPGGVTPAQKDLLRQRLGKLPIGMLPGAASTAYWWLLDLGVPMTELTWADVAGGVKPQDYPILCYCGGEAYQRTVQTPGDVDKALIAYQKAGGCLVALPLQPWPFFVDETGKAQDRSYQFGLTLRWVWEQPPAGAAPQFVQQNLLLPHVPNRFDFPASGDLRWRPFSPQNEEEYINLLTLWDSAGGTLGDAVVYARPSSGGQVAYAWFGLLDMPVAEPLLYDLFSFLATRLGR